ncbi:hypothetical protein N8862_01560 [Pseudomonadales bacterium]|nr:hypothetical protein [Pseudomonadales bacterium]
MSKFLDTIVSHANQLEWTLEKLSDARLRLSFNMGEGRSQNVLISHYPNGDEDSSDLVEIASAALKMDGFPDGKLGAEMAKKLLKQNATTAFSSWAIEDTEDGPYLVAMSGWMLDDLDAEEFELAALIVANAADEMEGTLGIDNF